jgi:hypothetical protein
MVQHPRGMERVRESEREQETERENGSVKLYVDRFQYYITLIL